METLKLDEREVQIEASDAIPIIEGFEYIHLIHWFKLEPGKITVCFYENGEEMTREYNIAGVKLSGLPVDYSFNKA